LFEGIIYIHVLIDGLIESVLLCNLSSWLLCLWHGRPWIILSLSDTGIAYWHRHYRYQYFRLMHMSYYYYYY